MHSSFYANWRKQQDKKFKNTSKEKGEERDDFPKQ